MAKKAQKARAKTKPRTKGRPKGKKLNSERTVEAARQVSAATRQARSTRRRARRDVRHLFRQTPSAQGHTSGADNVLFMEDQPAKFVCTIEVDQLNSTITINTETGARIFVERLKAHLEVGRLYHHGQIGHEQLKQFHQAISQSELPKLEPIDIVFELSRCHRFGTFYWPGEDHQVVVRSKHQGKQELYRQSRPYETPEGAAFDSASARAALESSPLPEFTEAERLEHKAPYVRMQEDPDRHGPLPFMALYDSGDELYGIAFSKPTAYGLLDDRLKARGGPMYYAKRTMEKAIEDSQLPDTIQGIDQFLEFLGLNNPNPDALEEVLEKIKQLGL